MYQVRCNTSQQSGDGSQSSAGRHISYNKAYGCKAVKIKNVRFVLKRTFFISPKNIISISILYSLDAIFADELAVETFNVVCISAENAGRLIFLEKDLVILNKALYSVTIVDSEILSEFNGKNESSEFVDFSYYAC